MQVRLKMPWGSWSKGKVFTDMPGGQARTLIARNIAEEFDPAESGAPASGQAAFKAPADRAVRPSQTLRKAR